MKENKNTISTAAVQYATVESLNTEARTRANADSQIRTTIQVLSDDYEDFKENGGGSGGVSKDYVDTQDALKQNINDTTLTTTSKTIVGAINENVTNIATKQNQTDNTLNTTNKTIVDAINENLTSIGTKQDTLVDSGDNQNIKTINSQSILGTGDITIDSGSTNLDNNIEIYDNENNNFVQYKATDLDWTVASNDSLTSKNYVDTQDTTITNSVSQKADTTYVDTQDALKQNITDNTLTTTSKTIVGAINENVTNIATKQNTLVDNGDNQNIKTINSQSILGTGDITIDGGSTELDNNIEIYDNEDNNFVQYKATDLDWTAASNDSLTSKSYVDTQDATISNSVNLKADTTYVDTQDALKQNITDNTLTTTSKTITSAINENVTNITTKQNQIDNTLNTTNKTIVGAINENLTSISTKQNTLVDSGDSQNIKTINSQTLLGTGNITIDGGSTELDNNIEIYDNNDNNFVQYKATDLDWTSASDNSLTSKNYVDTQDTTITNSVNLKANTTYVDTQDALKQNITDNTLTTTSKTIVGAINENVTTINTKQNITDNTLNTTSKTIVGSINENLTSISTKQDTLVDSGNNQNIKTINSQSLLGTGNITIDSGNTDLDNNIEIYDNEDNNFIQYKATDLDWTAASDDSLTSKSYVDQQDTTITNSVSQKADTTYVDTQDNLKQNITDNTLTTTSKTIVGAINENVITINTKQNQTDNTLNTTSKTIVGSINENLTSIGTKQDTLVDSGDSQNIKTINSQSILGTGNITINDGGSTDLDNNIEIYDNEDNNFVQYKATNLDWTVASDDSLTSKSYVDQQDTTITNSVNQKADTTYVNTQDNLKQNITDNALTTTNKTITGAINENVTTIGTKQNQTDNTLNTTSKTVVGAINENLTSISTKQDTLVDSGDNQNIKTINGTSLLGTGDIEITGSGSTELDNNIEIYDNEDNNFVQYKATNLDWTAASDDSLTSKSYVDTQDALKQNITDTTLTTTSKTIVGAINELVINKQGTLTLPTGTNPGNPGTGNALQLDSNNNMYIKTDTSLGQIGNLLYANYSTLGDSIGTVKSFSDLNTNSKTIIGGINENLTSIETKQATLVDSGDSQNIKTINGQSILGTGNIDISVDGSSPLEDNIEIYDNEDNNFVQYKTTDLDWSAASDDSLTSKSYVDQQDTTITNSVSLKADTTYVDTQLSNKVNIIDSTNGTLSSITFERKTSDNTIVCIGIASNANSNVWTESTITNAIATLQPLLTAGTNITISNNVISAANNGVWLPITSTRPTTSSIHSTVGFINGDMYMVLVEVASNPGYSQIYYFIVDTSNEKNGFTFDDGILINADYSTNTLTFSTTDYIFLAFPDGTFFKHWFQET